MVFLPGVAVSCAGELIQVWCFASLDKNRMLAVDGPYAIVRNPMYIGRFFLVIGILMLTGNIALMAVFCVGYYFYMVNRVRREERRLRVIFGRCYENYCKRVPRFVPELTVTPGWYPRYFNLRLLVKNHAAWNFAGVLAFFIAAAARVFLM